MRKKFLATYTGWIILVNVVFWLLLLVIFPPVTQNMNGIIVKVMNPVVSSNIALQPASVLAGQKLWTFITSMFMHSQVLWFHIFANMISLMFIGSFVERLIGKKRFLGLYFGAGIFAGLFFVLITKWTGGNMLLYAVGASGALFGLGGLLAVLTPRLPVLVMFIIPMPMWLAMVVLMFGLWAVSLAAGLPIGNLAHLGGLLVGVGYGFYLKKKYPRKTQMIARYFSR